MERPVAAGRERLQYTRQGMRVRKVVVLEESKEVRVQATDDGSVGESLLTFEVEYLAQALERTGQCLDLPLQDANAEDAGPAVNADDRAQPRNLHLDALQRPL